MSNRLQPCSGPAITAPARPIRLLSVWRGPVTRLCRWLSERHQRQKSINRLQLLNPWLLRDIGIVREDIASEVEHLLSEQRFGMMGQPWPLPPDAKEDWRAK